MEAALQERLLLPGGLRIVPSGTLPGGILLMTMNESLRRMIGGLFSP